MLDDDCIVGLLAEGDFATDVVEQLIQDANKAGGKDNVTAIVGFFHGDDPHDGYGGSQRDTDLYNAAD